MWKPVEQWSHLISLAIYHPLSSVDSGLLPQASGLRCRNLDARGFRSLCMGFDPRTRPTNRAERLCGDAVHRQVSWLVLAKKGRREPATIAPVGVRDEDEAKSRGPKAGTAKEHQVNRGDPDGI